MLRVMPEQLNLGGLMGEEWRFFTAGQANAERQPERWLVPCDHRVLCREGGIHNIIVKVFRKKRGLITCCDG